MTEFLRMIWPIFLEPGYLRNLLTPPGWVYIALLACQIVLLILAASRIWSIGWYALYPLIAVSFFKCIWDYLTGYEMYHASSAIAAFLFFVIFVVSVFLNLSGHEKHWHRLYLVEATMLCWAILYWMSDYAYMVRSGFVVAFALLLPLTVSIHKRLRDKK